MLSDFRFCVAYLIVDALCLVINIIIARNTSRDSGTETQVRCFFLLLTSNLLFVIFDAIWALLIYSGAFEPNELSLAIVNGVCLTAIALTAYFWFCFALARFESKILESRPLLLAAAIPVLAVPIIHIIGHFTGQNIILTPEGLSYGVVHTIDAFIPLLYLLASTIIAIYMYRRAVSTSRKHMCVVFILFMVAPAAAGVFDMFIPDMPVAAAGILISIIFVMMSMQRMQISNDALTGLNNRRRADEYLEECMMRVSPEHPLHLFIIDMDRFKSINDTYGHLEGDHALQLMADALRAVSSRINAFAARWGGDEFVMICTKHRVDDPERVATNIKDALATAAREARVQYELACSVGYSMCESSSTSRAELIAGADEMLYRAKQERR